MPNRRGRFGDVSPGADGGRRRTASYDRGMCLLILLLAFGPRTVIVVWWLLASTDSAATERGRHRDPYGKSGSTADHGDLCPFGAQKITTRTAGQHAGQSISVKSRSGCR